MLGLAIFFASLHIIQLTPHQLSAELNNRLGAKGASAWLLRQKIASKEETRPPPVSVSSLLKRSRAGSPLGHHQR